MKRILLFIVLISLALGTLAANEKKWQVAVLAGAVNVAKNGSNADYVLGENDFPVTPSHFVMSFGLSLDYALTRRVVLQIAGRSFSPSHVTLEDPSDKDIVEIDTAKHFSIAASAIYMFAGNILKPYLLAGIGADVISERDKTFASAAGYQILFRAPTRKIDPLINIGAGLQFHFSQVFGILADTRYTVIFSRPHNGKTLNLSAGLFLKL